MSWKEFVVQRLVAIFAVQCSDSTGWRKLVAPFAVLAGLAAISSSFLLLLLQVKLVSRLSLQLLVLTKLAYSRLAVRALCIAALRKESGAGVITHRESWHVEQSKSKSMRGVIEDEQRRLRGFVSQIRGVVQVIPGYSYIYRN